MADANDRPHLHVEFSTKPVENPAESKKQGRPIFDNVEFVTIKWAGDPKNVLVAPANSPTSRRDPYGNRLTYAQRFPQHYEAFKQNEEQTGAGTPLSEVTWLSAAKREELKALNIFTVDALASLDGAMLQRIGMGARDLKNKAQAWLDNAAGSAGMDQMQREMDELRAQIAALTGAKGAEPVENDPYADYSDDDLKNLIADAKGARPTGRPSRKTLVATLAEIAAEKDKAA